MRKTKSRYTITPYSYKQAKKHNVSIKRSTTLHKKLDVFDSHGTKIATVGDDRYKDYPTYMKENGKAYAERRRRLYKMRHESDRYVKGSNGYWADVLLW